MASRAALPPCPGCAGGGQINGVECRDCRGTTRRAGRQARDWLPEWRGLPRRAALAAAGPAGTAVRWCRPLPGIGGAAGVSWGLAMIVHGVFGQVPELGVAAAAAGAFGLMLDRKL